MRHYLLTTALLAAATALAAQSRAAFIVRIGTDTVAVEQFERSTTGITGTCVVRTPRTVVRDYTITFGPDGSAARFVSANSVLELSGERAGAVPFVNNCWGLLELATRRFVAAGGRTVRQPAFTPGPDPQPRTVTVERRARDSLTVTVIAGLPYRVAVDTAGAIRGAAWAGEWTVERVAALDIELLARAFERHPLGPLSPADSVRASVGGATLSVKYGRPARRGRTVFGGIVPWNEVWRTGANEATLLTTTADLEMGGTTIPAGSYTLWTLPAPRGWKLIVNRNTGQWGTEYDATHDLVRLDMRVERLATAVERFTIAIEPRGAGGVLQLEWEATRASIEFRPKAGVGG